MAQKKRPKLRSYQEHLKLTRRGKSLGFGRDKARAGQRA